MAIGHISIRVHTRSKGHSAAAGIAYRMGVDLVDPRTGVEHLYARRTKYGDIVDCGMAGAGAFGDVAAFAAAIEAAEKRRNSSLMRDVQVALPCELEEDQCTSLTAEFAALVAQRYRTHTAWSVHRPDKRADARNQHGHIVVPTRELVNGVFERKLRILDDHKTGRVEVAEIRKLWERTANTHLARAGHTARVDVSRREDGNPVPTLGRGCTAIEREAAVERGELVENRSVADLVSTGSAVTWRGRALRRHQLRERQKARQEERAKSTAPEDEVATIAVTEAQPQAQAAPIRVSLGAPSMARPAGGRRAARAQAVATPARIDLKQREASGRRALRVHTVQAHTVAKPVTPCTPARRLEGAAVREVREQAVAAPARIDLQPRRTSRRGGGVPPSALIAARVRQEPSVTPAQPRTRTRTVSSPVELRVAQPAASATPVRLEMRSRPAAGPLARPSATRAQPILRGTDRAQPMPGGVPPSALIAARVRQEPSVTPAQPRTRTRTVSSPVELRVAQPAASATPVRLEMRSRPAAGPLARPSATRAQPILRGTDRAQPTPTQPRTRTRTVGSPVELRVAQPAASATPVRLEMRSRPAAGPLARPSATRAQPILRGTDRAQPTPTQPRTRTRTVGSPVELRVAQPAASATPVRLEMRSRPAAGPLARPPAAVAAPVHPRPTPIQTERLALPELATTWDAAEEAVRTFPDLSFGLVGADLANANLEKVRGIDIGIDIVAKAEEIQTREESQPPYMFEERLHEFLQWLQEKLEEMFRLVGLHKEAAAREKQDAEARDPRFHTPPASGRELKLHGYADAAIKARRPEPHRGVRGGDAQNNLGGMYEFGRGVPQDYGEAVRWYRLAADQGHASAQRNLGGMYADGRGVPQDDVAAHMWANLAAAQGDETARKLRDYLSERMSSGQIAAAQRAAREWRPAFQSR